MIRIFLPLLLAVAAYFGPWTQDFAGSFSGADSAGSTVDCFLDLEPGVTGPCAPTGAVLGQKLVGYTVIVGAGAAVLSVLGLLPLIGRLTSLAVIGAGLCAVAAAALIAVDVNGPNGAGFGAIGWGAYASIVLGLANIWSGIDGARHGNT
ncbi:MAG: hypothetical protein AAGG79_00460 [Pseudomonadota bacterium]